MTKIIELKGDDQKLDEILFEPAKILREGGTVAFPTETVYGLGGNALSEISIDKIYLAKGRPSDNPLIVHISKLEQLDMLASEINGNAKILMDKFWPGPITFVLKKLEAVPLKTTGGLDTVAVRMPMHPVALKLIELAGVPVAAPSANISGRPSPTNSSHVIEDLYGRVDCIIKGESAAVGLESTVLDVTEECPVILRPGNITKEMIEEVVGCCKVDPGLKNKELAPKSPGMKYRHYAPVASVEVYVGDTMSFIKRAEERILELALSEAKVGIMAFDEDLLVIKNLIKGQLEDEVSNRLVFYCSQGSSKDLTSFARLLFESLRECDANFCDVILIRGVDEDGIGHAIMNRLNKAASGKVMRI